MFIFFIVWKLFWESYCFAARFQRWISIKQKWNGNFFVLKQQTMFLNHKKHSKAKEGSIEDCYLQNRPHMNPNITDEIPVPQFICFQIFLKHFLLAKWRNEHLLISPTLHLNAPRYWPLKINIAKIANAVSRRNLLWVSLSTRSSKL